VYEHPLEVVDLDGRLLVLPHRDPQEAPC
jgi:hypothetical protein